MSANLATTPTGFFPVDGGVQPKFDAATYDTVAADATKAVFDASFDQTVEWHDPYLDPDITSLFSDWSPDFLPQSTVGGFASWFKTDAGLADSSPTLPVATMVTSSASASEPATCSKTQFRSPVKFTHFTTQTRSAAEAAPDQGTQTLGASTWTTIRDSLRMTPPEANQFNSNALSRDAMLMTPPEADRCCSHELAQDAIPMTPLASAQCSSTALIHYDVPVRAFSSYFRDDGHADLYHPGPVLDPVDPWVTPTNDRTHKDAEEIQASFDSFGGSATNYTVEDDDGVDVFNFRFDAHGNLFRFNVTSHDYATNAMKFVTRCYQVSEMVGDAFVPGFEATSGELPIDKDSSQSRLP